jgi:hypothetical protein
VIALGLWLMKLSSTWAQGGDVGSVVHVTLFALLHPPLAAQNHPR